MPRVVITGIGLATSLGLNRESTWSALRQGKRGARRLVAADFADHLQPLIRDSADWLIGAPVALPRTPDESRLTQLARVLALEAVHHRGGLSEVPPERRGVVLGTSKTDLSSIDSLPEALWTSHPCQSIAAEFDCQGAAVMPVAACATGLISLIRAADLIASGTCDVVLAGSVDASLHPAVLGSYRRLGVLANNTGDPATSCKPFDRDRSGFVMGEGGAMLIMERLTNESRHRALAEWVGGTFGSDQTGIAQVDESGASLAELLRRTLRRTNLTAGDIDAFSLHGTATHSNDIAEARAVAQVLGNRDEGPPCFGIKGSVGHLLGAAGAVETAICVLALRDGVLPPTMNLVHRDERCQLNLTGGLEVPISMRRILKTSLGFGGHIAAAIVQFVDPES